MAAPLSIRVVYDRPCMEELQRVAGRTFSKKKIGRWRGVLFCVGLLGLVIAVPTLASGQGIISGIGCLLIGVLMTVWSLFFYKCTAWTSSLAMKKRDAGAEYVLEKDAFTLASGGQKGSVPYTACKELVEAERCFYLLMEGGQTLMMDKSMVSGGTAHDVRAWLEEKCGKRFTWAGTSR